MKLEPDTTGTTRRDILAGGAFAVVIAAATPGRATDEAMRGAIREFTGEAPVRPGRVTLDLPPLVENGNTVPMTVRVDSAMTPQDHVTAIAVFNEKNPQPHVATFHLGPRCGRAAVSTRIRLADSQTITAIARMSDGTLWSATADVVVTLAACVEGL